MEFFYQLAHHPDRVLVQRSLGRLALPVGLIVFRQEGIHFEFVPRYLRVMVLVMCSNDGVHKILYVGVDRRGAVQTLFCDIFEVKVDQRLFQFGARDLVVVVRVVLLEFGIYLLDILQFPGNALKVIKVNNFVLPSNLDTLLLKRILVVRKGICRENLAQTRVCTTSRDSSTSILVDIFENGL